MSTCLKVTKLRAHRDGSEWWDDWCPVHHHWLDGEPAEPLQVTVFEPPRLLYCEHHVCRCARARELLAIADRTGSARYIQEAVEAHSQRVRCILPRELRE